MNDFFISYRSTDVDCAKWIAWTLKEAGFAVVYQAEDFRVGPPVIHQINKALASAACTLAVLSPDHFQSPWCELEWEAALTLEITGTGHHLILIRVKHADFPPLLAPRAWIEFIGADQATAKTRLLESVKPALRPPASEPAFPGGEVTSPAAKPEGFFSKAFRNIAAMIGNQYLTGPVQMEYKAPVIPGQVPITPPDQFPGRPDVWNIPHAWNPNFVGRDELLADLHKALVSGKRAALTQAVTGLGGIGKTQLAIEYADRHAGEYDIVWWVRSESLATAGADLSKLAKRLGLPEADVADQQITIDAVRQRLEPQPRLMVLPKWEDADDKINIDAIRQFSAPPLRWLLIFDNAEEPQALQNILPRGGSGHVIITSRNPNWKSIATLWTVKTFERQVSVDFLLQRTGQTDRDSADRVAEELGDLPLALAQAAGYMERTGRPLKDYLPLLRERRAQLWQHDKPPDGYEQTVTETFTINLESIETKTPAAGDLLNLCAFLAPDDIPLDVLIAGEKHLPERLATAFADPLALDEMLEELRRYSLMERSDNSLSLHRLVQAVVRDRLPVESQQTWCASAVQVINAAYPGDVQTNLAT